MQRSFEKCGRMRIIRNAITSSAIGALIFVSACSGAKSEASPSISDQTEELTQGVSSSSPGAHTPLAKAPDPITRDQTPSAEPVASAPAFGSAATMIVLDSSGSMWGQIDGRPKREIAREALQKMLPNISPGGDIGLVAYGHRREGDCSDIEILHEALPGERDALIDTANGLNALGKTPLTEAVRVAAQSLSIEENRASVILVTDGLETCNADPCALGEELESKGVDFTAHVIGFGLTQSEGQQVACLADATGGLYLEARNADDLEDAFEVVADSDTLPVEVESTASAMVDASDYEISATASFDVIWAGPKNGLDSLLIRSLDGETKYDRVYIYSDEAQSPSQIRAPEKPGRYAVHYETRQGRSLAMDEITVVDADARVTVPTEAITANTYFEVSFIGPENEFDRIQIFTQSDDESGLSGLFVNQAADRRLTLLAPPSPGTYSVRYLLREGRAISEAEIMVSSPAASIRPPSESIIAGAYFDTEVSDNPGQADKVIIVDPGNPRKPIDEGYVQYAKNGSVRLLAPLRPGMYDMQYIDGAEDVLAGGQLRVVGPDTSLILPSDPVRVGSNFEVEIGLKHGEFDQLVLVAQTDPSEEIASTYLNTAKNGKVKFFNPIKTPGTYLVRYQNRDGDVLATYTLKAVSL